MKALEYELKSVRHEDDLRVWGWTYLGDTDYKDSWYRTAQIWCKKGEFALLNVMRGTDECKFIKFIEHSEAIVGLYPYVKTFVDVFKQQDGNMAKVSQTKTCSNCGNELKKEQRGLYYLGDSSDVYVFCSVKCLDEYKKVSNE